MNVSRLLVLVALLASILHGQEAGNFLDSLLRHDTTGMGVVLQNPDQFKVQLLYTRIDRNNAGKPAFTTFSWRLNDSDYFYPASTVKFPACLVTLEKLNYLKRAAINRDTPIRFDSVRPWQHPVTQDPSAPGGLPTLAHYIKKVLLVSDNDAYNRLYEFLGQDYINNALRNKGYARTTIITRLAAALTPGQNRYTNPVVFYSANKELLRLPGAWAPVQGKIRAMNLLQGSGYYRGDELVRLPMDFTYKNNFPLSEQHRMLRAVFFPESIPVNERFNLTDDDYGFIRKYMGMFPRESYSPLYSPYNDYWDSYVKFFLFGDSKDTLNGDIRIYNKVGTAYGYLIDNAYIADYTNNIDFMLSAVIYCNADGIFNDDRYEYDTVGFPFLAAAGRAVYAHELKRRRGKSTPLPRFTP